MLRSYSTNTWTNPWGQPLRRLSSLAELCIKSLSQLSSRTVFFYLPNQGGQKMKWNKIKYTIWFNSRGAQNLIKLTIWELILRASCDIQVVIFLPFYLEFSWALKENVSRSRRWIEKSHRLRWVSTIPTKVVSLKHSQLAERDYVGQMLVKYSRWLANLWKCCF